MFIFRHLRQTLNSIIKFFKPSTEAWVGASLGVIAAGLFFWGLTSLNLFKTGHIGATAFYFLSGILLALIFCGIILLLITLLKKLPLLYQWALGIFLILMYFAFMPFSEVQSLVFLYLSIIFFVSLLGGAFWSFLKNPSKISYITTAIFVLSGLVGLSALAFWLVDRGPSFRPSSAAYDHDKIRPIDLPDPSIPGPFSVESLSYGSGKDLYRPEYGKNAALITKSVDGSPFILGWDGLDGALRTWYWGFDDSELPLNGRVWYPLGNGPFPLVLIVHGNHEMGEFSDEGYRYLGELFASHGFIAVSIDENFLNNTWFQLGDFVEGMTRGWLLLEHLKAWQEWNETPQNPFFQKVDMDHIALIGHSRGGEAVAIAAALNPLQYYPGQSKIRFDYGFNIVSLAGIAPIDGRYIPGGIKINLDNINYFVLHGSNDGDVRSFEGSEQYQRIKFVDDPSYQFKSALYIFGANHGQFNEKWGLRDISWPSSLLYALGEIMPEKEQQQIAKVYLTAFLKATLKGETGYLPLFRHYLAGKKWLPETLYLSQFEDSTSEFVISRKELDLTKTSLKGGSLAGKNLEIWRQEAIRLKDGAFFSTGIFLGWNACKETSEASYTITLPKDNSLNVDQNSVLTLSLANANTDSGESTDPCDGDGEIDFSIELTDKNSEVASVALSSFAYLPPTAKVEIMKSSLLDELKGSEIVLQTFEFPVKDFLAINPSLNPNELQTIRLVFDRSPSGLIVLDKLGFRKEKMDHHLASGGKEHKIASGLPPD